jgi:FdhD protein
MQSERDFPAIRLGFLGQDDAAVDRAVPVEAPIAIEYNGIGYAVMMATPVDLEAYAIGFTICEGLVAAAGDVGGVQVHAVAGGWVVRVRLPADRMDRVIERARTRASESSCGLCGIETIEEVLRPLHAGPRPHPTSRAAIARALAALSDHQPLGRATGAVHAAAFCDPDGSVRFAKEDVGRHNALDKLIGTLAIEGIDPAAGFILLSARCSYEIVEKSVRAGCPMLVTISAPTSLAVERAAAAGLTLVALARADSALVLNDPFGGIQ